MIEDASQPWMIDGFQTVVALWGWTTVTILHAIWRAMRGEPEDSVRESGPIP